MVVVLVMMLMAVLALVVSGSCDGACDNIAGYVGLDGKGHVGNGGEFFMSSLHHCVLLLLSSLMTVTL